MPRFWYETVNICLAVSFVVAAIWSCRNVTHAGHGTRAYKVTKLIQHFQVNEVYYIFPRFWTLRGTFPHLGEPLWSLHNLYCLLFFCLFVFSVHPNAVYLFLLVLHSLCSQCIDLHLGSTQFSANELYLGKAVSILRNRKFFPRMPECLMSPTVVERHDISKNEANMRMHKIRPDIIRHIYVFSICNFLPPSTIKLLLLYSALQESHALLCAWLCLHICQEKNTYLLLWYLVGKFSVSMLEGVLWH